MTAIAHMPVSLRAAYSHSSQQFTIVTYVRRRLQACSGFQQQPHHVRVAFLGGAVQRRKADLRLFARDEVGV